MGHLKKITISITLLLGVVCLGFLAYLPLLTGYFIQDEWQLFSTFYSYNKPISSVLLSYLVLSSGQYVPLAEVSAYMTFLVFKLNYLGYFISGLLLHLLVGTLLGYLLYRITRKTYLGFFGALFFIIVPNHFQATSWIIANFGYSSAAILFILGLSFFFKWLKKENLRLAVISSFFLFLSLLAKEITIFIFIALPIITYIWTKDFKKIIRSAFIVLPVFLFALWHYLFLKLHPVNGLSVQGSFAPVNITLLPVKALAQSVIPQEWIFQISRLLTSLMGPKLSLQLQTTAFELFAETTGAAIVVILISFLLMLVGVWIYKWSKKYKEGPLYFKMYLTGLVLAALSGLPFIFVDTPNFTLLQPRYSYIGVFGICFSLTAILYIGYQKWGKRVIVGSILILLLFGYTTWSMSFALAQEGGVRKNILTSISQSIPDNSKITVIYTESDSSFYGLPADTHILPFQNGLGKTLSVYLHDKVYVPEQVYQPDILWPIESQGYYQDKNGGFGYFRNYSDLLSSMRKNKINPDNVYAFSYYAKLNTLLDIIKQTREKLKKDSATF